ncbi:hypothetical protein N431DRAFT_527760 [Stipitochalara longipes BDJ]|nr:hypothetical protein N431DRAFT_527760 [Stipitochalara longipes BDJ]
MRLHFLLLGLFAGLEVLALNTALPWEIMGYYAAYKAEWLAGLTGAQRMIATQCKRNTKKIDGSDFDEGAKNAGLPVDANGFSLMCSFDDFVKFIGDADDFDRYYATKEGTMWDFDQQWSAIADKFRAARKPAPFQIDLQKLLPKGGFTGVKEEYAPAVKQIANALQAARAAAPAAAQAVINALVGHASEYARIAQQYRSQDGAHYPTDTINAYFNDLQRGGNRNPFTLVMKDQVNIPRPAPYAGNLGNYNNEADFDATLTSGRNAQPSAKPEEYGKFRTYYKKNYLSSPETIEHNTLIQAFVQVKDMYDRPDTTCRLPLKRRDLFSVEERYSPEDHSLEERDLSKDPQSMSSNSYQSHLVQADIEFIKINVTSPEQSLGYSIRMDAVSV